MMRMKKSGICVFILLLLSLTLTACEATGRRREPVTLTVWHVYGGQTDSPLNDLIEELRQKQ